MYTDYRVGSGLAKWQSTVSQHLVTSRDAAAATRRILSLTAVHAAHTRLMVTIKYIKISHTHTRLKRLRLFTRGAYYQVIKYVAAY